MTGLFLSAFIAGLFVLLALSAYFSAAETALFSLSSLQIKYYRSEGSTREKLIAWLVSRPRDLLVTLMMLNVQVNVLIQNMISTAFQEEHSWLMSVGLPLILTLCFGEIIPKAVALANNQQIAHRVAPLTAVLLRALGPIRSAAAKATEIISRMMFFFLKKDHDISTEELQHVLRTSQTHGVLHAEEVRLAWGYLSLCDTTAKEVMRPRGEMHVYDLEEPLETLTTLFRDEKLSRVPVCDGSLNDIVGIISIRRFFLERAKITTPKMVASFCDKPFYVPESMPAQKLLSQLTERDEEMAIVVDEYGTISGLVTREDFYEVVIGEIYSHPSEKSLYTLAGQDTIIASGKLDLNDFDAIFGIPLESDAGMTTVGGWLTEQIGNIPKNGAEYVANGFLFKVLAADPNRVRRIYIRRLSAAFPSGPVASGGAL